MKFSMKKKQEPPKTNTDSNEDFPSDEMIVAKKNAANGGKTSKKMFVTITIMIAWMVALTVVLLIFILENSKGNLEDRVRMIETKVTPGKVGGKILVPESSVITDIQKRLTNLENQSGAALTDASGKPIQIDNQILAGISDRLKKVEEKLVSWGPTAKGETSAKTGTDYSELKDRIDRLESLISKSSVSAQVHPPKEKTAKPDDAIVTAKAESKKTAGKPIAKKKTVSKKMKAPSYDYSYKSRDAADQQPSASRGFLTQQTGGYQPVSSGAAVIQQLSNHYDSSYNQHLDDLRGFSSRTLDESLQAGKTIVIPTGK